MTGNDLHTNTCTHTHACMYTHTHTHKTVHYQVPGGMHAREFNKHLDFYELWVRLGFRRTGVV